MGISQLTFSFNTVAPVCTISLSKFPNGPTPKSAIGIAINIMSSGFRKNLITDGEYFSANLLYIRHNQTLRMIGTTEDELFTNTTGIPKKVIDSPASTIPFQDG